MAVASASVMPYARSAVEENAVWLIELVLERTGLTKTGLAQRLAIHPSHLSKWLAGQEPGFRYTMALLELAQLIPDTLPRYLPQADVIEAFSMRLSDLTIGVLRGQDETLRRLESHEVLLRDLLGRVS